MPDRRNQDRNLCSDIVELSWVDQFGMHQMKGVLEDVSKAGGCVQTEDSIPLGADVWFQLRETSLAAKVCYCTLISGGYYVGVEFAGMGWNPGVSFPRHLLVLPGNAKQTATLD